MESQIQYKKELQKDWSQNLKDTSYLASTVYKDHFAGGDPNDERNSNLEDGNFMSGSRNAHNTSKNDGQGSSNKRILISKAANSVRLEYHKDAQSTPKMYSYVNLDTHENELTLNGTIDKIQKRKGKRNIKGDGVSVSVRNLAPNASIKTSNMRSKGSKITKKK